ncbi:MAG: ATPase [Bacteroidetes bacterium]|nr:ATPase [Bacteroidota bacterium]
MLKKIAITGPESTGKSILTDQLANFFQTIWVQEYARTYIDHLNRPYEQKDILQIAKNQVQQVDLFSKKADDLLFVDTELLVTKIWSEVKYGECDPWIIDQFEKQDYDLYLLCAVDLPWEPDPQREHPEMRHKLFKIYQENLEKYKLNYKIVKGSGSERLMNAVGFVNSCLD